MQFWLTTHMDAWLATAEVPLMVSHRRLARRKTLLRAVVPWVLDSGGFTELSMFGEWRTTHRQYATAARRYIDEIGRLVWIAPQDWMCEPEMLAKTGLTAAEHQRRSVASFLDLRADGLPVIPPLQGYTLAEYHACADLLEREGVDLAAEPVVGLGSVCRRQATGEIAHIVASLAGRGLRLHGFGCKTEGFRLYALDLASADSAAWSRRARKAWRHDGMRRAGCQHRGSCANCYAWALDWRERVLTAPSHQQLSFAS